MSDFGELRLSGEVDFEICRSLEEAGARIAESGKPVYLAAENYPSAEHVVDKAFLDAAAARDSRILIEYPAKVHGIDLGELKKAENERTVVSSPFFGDRLPELTLLVQHNCWFREVKTAVEPHLALARVAGYRDAVYGLPDAIFPALFQHPDYPNAMIATTCFSNIISARFAPKEDWGKTLGAILTWLNNGNEIECDWEPRAVPSNAPDGELPGDAEAAAFKRNSKWFHNHIFFEHAESTQVAEGFASRIDCHGRQSLRPRTRGDCTGEAVMIPALDWVLNGNPESREKADGVMKTLFEGSELPDNNPSSPTYGGVKFYEHLPVYYGDDNCRAAIGCVLGAELTGNYEFTENILRCLLSILRTTGANGFRHGNLRNPESFAGGKTWMDYRDEDFVEYRPHYQAYMWTAFLQAFVLTGHREFRDKAVNAIRMTMENAFPAKLAWTNGITQEYARMILPLAMLVEIEDTREHRGWLKTATETLLENMSASGAIHEKMGDLKYGKYPSPRTNEKYGSTEAALIQENGDPACDLVYTVNYAFIGLHEAAVATGERYYVDAENKLADFLCRIQVRSETIPYLDGCWMRGFDDELWEFYGSSADSGWGAWCVESGWTNTWIAATFGLRLLDRPLLCRESAPRYEELFPKVLKEMSELREYRASSDSATPRTVAPGAE